MKRLTALFTIMLFAVLFAQSGNSGDGSNALNLEKPAETQCGTSGNFVDFSCNIMKALLKLGPIVAVIALIAGGAIYIYAQMFVTADQSWIDHVTKTGRKFPIPAKPGSAAATNAMPSFKLADIPDFALTNELGQPVSLRQYQGKAVALTFFFTRCPIPEYCPRLSRNMEEASAKLKAMTNGPTNWQFFSISFDPLDRPEVLQTYGRRYQYDPAHWSFLTGNPDHIRELTRGFGVAVASDGAFYTHDFATAVFDTTGRLQTLWRFGGNTSDLLVNEILKAAIVSQTAAVIGSK